ncbi:Ig-like domain-containing protein, partial [Lysinibacter cavernae]
MHDKLISPTIRERRPRRFAPSSDESPSSNVLKKVVATAVATLLLTSSFVGNATSAQAADEPYTSTWAGMIRVNNPDTVQEVALNRNGKKQLMAVGLGRAFYNPNYTEEWSGAKNTLDFVVPQTGGPFSPSEQNESAMSSGGRGTPANPAWLTTTSAKTIRNAGQLGNGNTAATAGDIKITQKVSYVAGAAYVRNDITATNTTNAPIPAYIGSFLDCYLGGSDSGASKVGAGQGHCLVTEGANAGATISMIALTPGSTVAAGRTNDVFSAAKNYGALTNSCLGGACSTDQDNSLAMKWQRTIPANGSETVTYFTSYRSDLKFTDLTSEVTVDKTEVNVGDTLTYELSLSNSGPAAAPSSQAGFLLPEGLTYVEDSASGAYDPATGTWRAGALAVGDTATITVTAKATAKGTYNNAITGTSSPNIDLTPCDVDSPDLCGPGVTVKVSPVIDLTKSLVTATPTELVADGAEASNILVTVNDTVGGPIAEYSHNVGITSSLGDVGPIVDNNDGTFSTTLKSFASGNATVKATVNGDEIPTTASVKFNPAPVDAAQSSMSLSTGSRLADGDDNHDITVTLKDPNGNAVSGQGLAIAASADPDEGTDIGTFVETTTAGTYTAKFTSTKAGTKTVHVALGGDAVTGSPQSATFIAGPVEKDTSSLVVPTDAKIAGVGSHEVVATVKDAKGNPKADVPVVFTSEATVANEDPVLTDEDGIAKMTISSEDIGDFKVAATVNSMTLPGSDATVKFIAGPPSVTKDGKSEFEVTSGPVEADGEKKHSATATIKDAFGNPVKDVTVSFAAADGATLSAPTAVTNKDGIAKVDITSTVADTYSISATVGSDAVKNSPLDVTFVTGAPAAAKSSWKITPDTELTADGSAAFIAEITLRDKNNNVVKDTEIGLTSHDNVDLSAGPYVTNSKGIATVKLTSTQAGTYDVRAALGAEQIGEVLSITFVAGEPTTGKDGKSSLTVTSDTRVADGSDKHVATATILDANGNPVKDVTVAFAAPSDAKLSAATAKTNTDGIASVDVTSKVANTYAIAATIDGKDVKNSPANVTFVSDEPELGDTGKSEFSVSGGTKKADGVETHKAEAVISDKNGNPVSGVLVDFAVDTDATLSSAQAETNKDGIASVTVKSLKSGEYSVSAQVGGKTVKNSPQTVKFVAGDVSVGDSGTSDFEVTTDAKLADGEDAHTATATIRDANGNLVEGVTVTFATEAGSSISSTTAVTTAGGTASVLVTSEKAGSYAVSAEVAGTKVKNSPASVTFIAGQPSVDENGKSTFSVTDGNKTADGSDFHTATAIVRDKKGNPVPDVVVEFGAGNAELDATAVTTDKDGVAEAKVTTTVAGTYAVSAKFGATALKGSPASVKFVADVPSIEEDGTSTFEVTQGGKTADGIDKHTATAIIRDANDNPVINATVDFEVEAGATLSATSGATDKDGKVTVNIVSQTAKSYLVSGSISGTAIKGSPASVLFIAGLPDLGKDGKSSFGVTDGTRTANGADFHEATTTVRDAKGNPIEGISVNFAVEAGATATPAAALTDVNGIATSRITSATARDYSVSAAVGGVSPQGSPASVKFVAGLPDIDNTGKSSFAVTSGAVEANGTAKHTATATLVDANGNPVEGVTVNFGADSGASLGAASAVTNSKGIATSDITSTKAGFYAISADVAGVTVRNSPLEVEFKSGAPTAVESSWTVTPEGPVTADGEQAYTATVTVRDSNKNPVAEQAVGFDVPAAVSISAGPYVSDAKGVITATFTSTEAGTYAVSAKMGAETIGKAKDIVFTAGESNVGETGTSTFAVSPGTRIADGADKHTATAIVTDKFNNPVKGVKVTFGAENGATLSKTEATTDENGRAAVDVTSEKVGNYAITALVDGIVVKGSPATAAFIADVPSVEKDGTSEFSVTTEDKTADGADTHTATATIRDAKGNPVPNAVVVFAAAAGADIAEATVQTGENGIATASITSTEAGTYAVSATLSGKTIKGSPANVTFVAGAPSVSDLGLSTFEVTDGERTANGTDAHVATATVQDAFGNPVEGVEVSFGTDADAKVSAAKVSTDEDGIAEITVTSKKAGTYAVTADAAGSNLKGSPASVTFAAGTPDLGKEGESALSITTGDRVANGTDPHTATATVRDENGNPVSGVVVDFAAATGATATPARGTTGANGTVTADITSAVADTYNVTATVAGTPLKNSPVTATFIAGDPSVGTAGTSVFSVTSGQVEADGVAQHTATATILDADKNPVEGVTVAFESEDGSNVSAATGTTNAQGIASVSVTSATAGFYLVSAQVDGIELKNSPQAVEFISGAPFAPESTWEITPSGTVTADGSDQFVATVTVRDKNENAVPNTAIGFTVPSDVIISEGPYVTDKDGVVTATFRSKKAGTYQVSSQIGAATIGDAKSITFVAGTANSSSAAITATPDFAEANGTHKATVTVTLFDEFGNPVLDGGDAVTINSTRGTVSKVDDNGDGTYTATVTSVTAGDAVFTFAVAGKESKNTATVEFIKTPTAPVVKPTNGTTVTGQAEANTSITVTNAKGETVGTGTSGATGEFTITITAPTKDGDDLFVVATDTHGFRSAVVSVKVDQVNPESPDVDDSNGSVVKGRPIAPLDSVTVVDSIGNPIPGNTTITDKGEFTFVPDVAFTETDNVFVVVTDPAGNKSKPVKIVVDTTNPGQPVIKDSNGETITGGPIDA